MRIKDFIAELSQYNQDIELVIDVDGNFITPSLRKDIVHFQHDYSGCSFKDEAIVLAKH